MPTTVGYAVEKNKLRNKQWKEAVVTARQKLEVGQRKRQADREDMWSRSEQQYIGNHWDGPMDDGTSDLVVVNHSFSTVNVIMPYMTGSDPRFLVVPYSGDATQRNAAIQQALLNRIWRSRKVAGRRHIAKSAWDYLVYGDGYVKVGYNISEKRTSEEEYEPVAELWVSRVSPWDVWIDPTSDGIHDARWVCQRLWLTREELQADERYNFTGESNVAYGSHSEVVAQSKGGDTEFFEEVFDGSEYAEVYEFFDLIHDRRITFSTGEYPLQVVEDIDGCPIVQLPNYTIPNSPYHMGELEQIWELQVELNKTRSHLITHRRRNVAKLFAKRGVLQQDALDALTSSVVNDVAFVDGDQPLDQLVSPVNLPNLSADVYNVSEMMQGDIYEITGVNEYLRGSSPDIRRTATEASIIEGASNIKSQFKLTQIEEMLRDVGAIMLGVAADVFPKTKFDELQLFLTGREAESVQRADMGEQFMGAQESGNQAMMDEIAGQMGQPQDVVVSPSPDIFVGKYEVEVEQHSTELRNPVVKEQKAREMATELIQMAPMLMELGVVLNYKRLLEDWFEKAGVDDVDGLLEGAAGPMQPPGMGAPAAPEGAGGPGLLPGMPPPDLQDPSQMGFLGAQNTGQMDPMMEPGAFPAA